MMAHPNDCPVCASEPDEPRPSTGGSPSVLFIKIWPALIRSNVWCETCLLPSVVLIDIVTGCRHGWPAGVLGRTAYCDEHKGMVPVPPDSL